MRFTELLEALGLAAQCLVVDALAFSLGKLFFATQLEHVAVEQGDGGPGLDEVAGFGNPLDAARQARGDLGGVAAEDSAGGGYDRRHVLSHNFRHGNEYGVVLCKQHGWHKAQACNQEEQQHKFRMEDSHQDALASDMTGCGARAPCVASPRRRMLGSNNSVKTALTLMPPTITVARPR